MSNINTLRCPGSLDGGILTLKHGRAIDLQKVQKALEFIANAPMPRGNDAEHDLLVDARAEAAGALAEFTNACS